MVSRAQAAAVVVVLGVAVAAAFVLATRSDRRAAAAPSEPVRVHTALTPRAAQFGDRVVAQADVLVDTARVAAGDVALVTDFAPYTRVGPPEVDTRRVGDVTELRYRWSLDCLERECLPRETARRIVFAPVRAQWKGGLATGIWSALRVETRVGAQDLARPGLRFDVLPLPAVSARVSPGTLHLLLLVGTALALLGAAALLAPELLALVPSHSRVDRRTPLERALAHVRGVRGDEDPHRRRALERLAREVDDPELETQIRELAWSPPSPDGHDMDRVAEQAEEAS